MDNDEWLEALSVQRSFNQSINQLRSRQGLHHNDPDALTEEEVEELERLESFEH